MRTLTFLFADLRDYTAFVERHGDVAATTLIADYRRVVRGEVARATGAEVKTEGDSFYVVFEAASNAVRCAISILREAHRYSRDRPDRPMRLGIGIHAGEPQPHEGQYVGGAVIVAARLAQQSRAGELLVTEVVRGLLPKGALPRTAERDGIVLKGIADAPRVHSVTWTAEAPPPRMPRVVSVEAAAPAGRTMVCPRVIGRTTELEALRTLLESARALRAAEGALAAFEAEQDARGAGEALSLMGGFRRVLGDQARGDEDIADAVRRLEPLGNTRELAVAYGRAAWAAMLDLRPQAAELGARRSRRARPSGMTPRGSTR